MDGQKIFVPVVYGTIHLVIDASTIGLLFAICSQQNFAPRETQYAILLYNALAFASQPIWGLLTDLFKRPRIVALAGIVLVLSSFLFMPQVYAAIVLAAIGNALFHVGGGIINLFVTPRRALAPGIFVAPGALGLGLGSYLGKSGLFMVWPLAVLLFIALAAVIFMQIPTTYANTAAIKIRALWPILAITLFFVSIFFRALVGYTAGFAVEKGLSSLIVLSLIACAGKACGGYLSDRWGWIKVSVGALLISAPLLAFNSGSLLALAGGMLFFQMTMPVTLTATAGVINKNPGLAFGLNCLALFFGVFVKFFPIKYAFYNAPVQLGSVLLATIVVFSGLFLLRGGLPKDKDLHKKTD